MRLFILRCPLLLLSMGLAHCVWANAGSPPLGLTGAPKESTCRDCHGRAVGKGGSVTVTGMPAEYVPGAVYILMVQVAMTGQKRWGFETTILKADGTQGGDLIATDTRNTRRSVNRTRGRTYIAHTAAGTANGTKDLGPFWKFDWKAPDAGSGPVTIYAAGNAANGNNSDNGDFIFTTSLVSQEGKPLPPPAEDLDGNGKLEPADAALLLRILVGIVMPTDSQKQAGDLNKDGKLDLQDVRALLQRAVLKA